MNDPSSPLSLPSLARTLVCRLEGRSWPQADREAIVLAALQQAQDAERESCCRAVCRHCAAQRPTARDRGGWWHVWTESGGRERTEYCQATEIRDVAQIAALLPGDSGHVTSTPAPPAAAAAFLVLPGAWEAAWKRRRMALEEEWAGIVEALDQIPEPGLTEHMGSGFYRAGWQDAVNAAVRAVKEREEKETP